MSKLLKILSIGVTLTSCGVTMGWWCDVCHRDHREPICHRYTTGYLEYRGCNDAYICADLLYDSEDEAQFGMNAFACRDYNAAEAAIRAKRRHRDYSLRKVTNFIRNATLGELNQIRSAVRERASLLGEDAVVYGCDAGYGCR